MKRVSGTRIQWGDVGTITEQIENKLMDRLENAANLVADRARALCPVGKITRPAYKNGQPWTERIPGTLRKSIRTARLKGDPKLDVRVIAGARGKELTAYYAHMVEYGSVHNSPKKPFLRPALSGIRSKIETVMATGGDVTTGISSGTWGDVLNWKPSPKG